LLAATFVAIAQVPQSTNETVSVSIPHLATFSGERIVALEIHVTAGVVQSVSNLPIGWYVVVDNDASWCTTIKGNTEVGAAALSAGELRNLRLTVKKDTTYQKFALSGTVSVTQDFEKTRSVSLGTSDFAVSPAK